MIKIDFGRWALRNNKFVFFLVAAMVVGGIFSYIDMSKLEDPEIKVKQAMVVTTYPGASAHEVELELTEPLELSLRSIKGVDNVISRSMDDVSIIEVMLKHTVPDEEVEQTWDILRRKINDTKGSLPPGANMPVVRDDFGDVFGMFYAITNDGYSEREMNKYIQLLKREVQNIEGVAAVEIYGLQRECINIELLQEKMANLGVHPVEVISTLNGQNEAAYSGYFLSGDHRIRVSVNDRYKNVDDISQLLLQGHEKDQLRLSDIASVTMGLEEPIRNEMLFDGANFAAMLSVNIPIFNWGEGRNKVKEAKVERLIAEMQLNHSQQEMTLEANQALNQLNEAQLDVVLSTKSVEQALENMEVSKEMYDAGMETLSDYMEAQTMWQSAMSTLVTARATLNLNRTKYLKATGRL